MYFKANYSISGVFMCFCDGKWNNFHVNQSGDLPRGLLTQNNHQSSIFSNMGKKWAKKLFFVLSGCPLYGTSISLLHLRFLSSFVRWKPYSSSFQNGLNHLSTPNGCHFMTWNVRGGFAKSAKCIGNPILKKSTKFSDKNKLFLTSIALGKLKLGM